MTRVIADISTSLDGYVTGPNAGPGAGLGEGGTPIHDWALRPDADERELLRASTERSGAVVMGRNLFDVVDGPGGWDAERGYGAAEVGTPPFVVVTHEPPASVRLSLDLTFVTEGVAAAVERARALAGEKDVVLMGGADVVRQAVLEGVADELLLHLAPVVLGGGTPLFPPGSSRQLTQVSAQVTTSAVHVTYRV